ncbi:MAG: HAMP domain-containing sensor histidine kinase [Bacillota bacterium]
MANSQSQNFSANIAHQLRTPLAAIQASAEVIQMLNHDPKIAEMTSIILRNTELARDTTAALLGLSRIENYLQGEKLALAEFDLDQIIRNEIDLIVQRGEPATRFNYTRCGACTIYAEPALLSQVVRNLLSNAVKYSPSASVIDIALVSENATLKLTVRDHGPGINEADYPHIFDRFYRSQTSKHLKGSGLGLSLTKAIVSLFHGDIAFKNNPAEGVTFTVLLPK